MKIYYNHEIYWFYLDKSIQILNKVTKNVITLKNQELEFWLEIDKNQTYSIILLNLYSQIDLEQEKVKDLFDAFLNRMIDLSILYINS